MGVTTIVAAHVLFNLAVVILIVRSRLAGMDRSLIEASEDLYATPFGTFRQVTLPLLMPAIVAGFLLSFTFSFEDFIIAFFVAGPNNTLPIYVFSSIRRGITPEINAIGTVVLAVSLSLLILAQFILRLSDPARKPGGHVMAEPCHDVAHLGHVELLTNRFEESLNFFVNVYGLTESGRDGGIGVSPRLRRLRVPHAEADRVRQHRRGARRLSLR